MTDHIAVLVLENAYLYYGENSFIGALSSKFTRQKNVFCLFVEYHIQAWYINLYYIVIATKRSQGISW